MLSLVLMLALSLVSVAPQPWELGQITWSFQSLGFPISRAERSHHLEGLMGRWVGGSMGRWADELVEKSTQCQSRARQVGRVAYFKGKTHVLIYASVRSGRLQQLACEGFSEEVGVDLFWKQE